MLLEVDHHSGVPVYRQIIDQIRRQIISGDTIHILLLALGGQGR